MMERVRAVWEQVQQRWQSYGSSQRWMVGGAAAAVVAALLIMGVLAQHVGYAVLYSNLPVDQAGAIVEKLQEEGVDYRLSDNGRTIRVPEKQKAKLRLDLQMDGSLDGVSGYKILDEGNGLGLTESDRKIRHQRALEGELTRTVRQLDEVVSARIHLVMPERGLFGDTSRPPTASVVLQLHPGAQLTRRQVAGIRALVAGSVEGLVPEQVRLVDATGNLISDVASGDDLEGNKRYDVQVAVSSTLEKKAQTLLDQVVGPGKSAVRIMADLDFERIDREIESFDPDGAVVRSEEISEGTGTSSGSSTSQVTNFEINRTVEHVKRAPGSIQRLTISVSVDGRREPVEGEDGTQFVPRSEAELAQLASFVKNSVGFNEARGDQFHIGCVEFGHDPVQHETQALQRVERQVLIEKVVGWGLWLVGMVLGFLLLHKVLGTLLRSMQNPSAPASEGLAPVAATAGASVTTAASAAATIPEPEGVASAAIAPVSAGASDAGEQVDAIMSSVSSLAQEKPEESAALVRAMLTESES